MKTDRNIGCIYKILNLVNGKVYIGKTIQLAEKRMGRHLVKSQGSRLVYRASHKYGADNLLFTIVERGLSVEMLDEREKYWIAQLDCMAPKGYNLTEGGDGGIPSEETRRKMSESRKGKTLSAESRRKISESRFGEDNPFFGRKHSAETKAKISITSRGKNNGNYGKTHSAEARRKISEANSGENNPNWGKHRPKEIGEMLSKTRKGEGNPMHRDNMKRRAGAVQLLLFERKI